MEFKINSSDLLKALSHIHGIVEVRHTLPILSNIILEALLPTEPVAPKIDTFFK